MFVVTNSALFTYLSVVQDFWTNEKMCTVIQNLCDPKHKRDEDT